MTSAAVVAVFGNARAQRRLLRLALGQRPDEVVPITVPDGSTTAAAVNRALAMTAADHLLVIDAPAPLGAGYLGQAVAALRAKPSVGMIALPSFSLAGLSPAVATEIPLGPLLAGTVRLHAPVVRRRDLKNLAELDERLHAEWAVDLALSLAGCSLTVEAGPRTAMGRFPPTVASEGTEAAERSVLFGKHAELYRVHASDLWREWLPQNERLAHLKRRYALVNRAARQTLTLARRAR